MKKTSAIAFSILFLTAGFAYGQKTMEMKQQNSFLKQADESLNIMVKEAEKMALQGACVIAFIPGNKTESWVSKMKIAGALQNGGANFLAIAYSKASEMADTFKDSGSGVREKMHGEFAYQGGVIESIDGGYILAVFSGGTGEQDVEIAKKGLADLKEKM